MSPLDLDRLFRQATDGQPPPVALVHGHDVQLLDDTLAAVTQGLCSDPNAAIFDREILDGREVTISLAIQSAMVMPVMAPRRLVAVRHCQALAVKGVDALVDYCARPNPTACLLLLAGTVAPAAGYGRGHHGERRGRSAPRAVGR